MKKFLNIKKSLLLILLVVILHTIYYIPYTNPAVAQVKLETGLPTKEGFITELPAGAELPNYIRYLFIFGLSLITVVALGQMIIGGITYILAAGNAAKVEDAKDTIFQALLGVGILLVSYLLLRTINPDLVNLRNPNLAPIQFKEKIGGGAEKYQWAKIPFNQYCVDVLGKDWRDVDSNHCPPQPNGVNSCCGYFPPK